jgi:hypothetical protein
MPARFEELARYNAEVSRGIVHKPEFVARMRTLRADFDEWTHQQILAEGFVETSPGVYEKQ